MWLNGLYLTSCGVNIVRVEAVGNYMLRLFFSDQHVDVINFFPFLERSLNPETRQFLEVLRFNTYRLEWGNLVWGDYAMCFPIEDLYEGRLEGSRALAVAEKGSEYGAQR